eukprot:5444185-Prymnesium_polylepis.1
MRRMQDGYPWVQILLKKQLGPRVGIPILVSKKKKKKNILILILSKKKKKKKNFTGLTPGSLAPESLECPICACRTA